MTAREFFFTNVAPSLSDAELEAAAIRAEAEAADAQTDDVEELELDYATAIRRFAADRRAH